MEKTTNGGKMNIFELAEMELRRERIDPNKHATLIIDRARTIRKWLDIQARNKAAAKARYNK